MQYVRDGARFWYDPNYDSSPLWEGVAPNTNLMRRVFGLLRDYDVARRSAPVQAPVFLALGRYDYALPYRLWDERKQALPHLSYHLFERSGHWPMLEESALFNQKLIAWLKQK